MDEQKATSYKIPSEWIDRIFKRFDEIWGAKFLNKFTSDTDFDLERIRWQSGLYGATSDEIRRVLDMCRTNLIKEPPNVIEFYHYCKGHKQTPPPAKPNHVKEPDREIAQKYLKLIKDKLHGRFNDESEIALSALDKQVLGDNAKEKEKPQHWQDKYD